jgi:hypothetical protein
VDIEVCLHFIHERFFETFFAPLNFSGLQARCLHKPTLSLRVSCALSFPFLTRTVLGRQCYQYSTISNFMKIRLELRHENSPVKVKRLTHTPAPRRPALLPVLSPRRSFPFSCTLSVDRIKCCLFPCGNTAFIGSDLDGTSFVPATIVVLDYMLRSDRHSETRRR